MAKAAKKPLGNRLHDRVSAAHPVRLLGTATLVVPTLLPHMLLDDRQVA